MSSTNKFIWDIGKLKKIKVKEIREFVIRNKGAETTVEVFGFFGGGVTVFSGSIEECRNFINEMTEGNNKEKE